ncbi:polysaccharide biosynthesis tyrosine autokinase [Sporolactobacillus sp. THM7-4]|nr:polysaccharide biosynthesis tyrosine autokinase [Sporolactobacillus sp. THM7-4]
MNVNMFRKKRPGQLITYFQKNSSFSEEYRTLRTNISLSKSGGRMRSLLVTSAESGSGKSMTAANLAVVMAQQGKKVLLMDANIRKPGLHQIFKTENQQGLTTLLTGQGDFLEVLQNTAIDNLMLMTSGPVSPNPADVISSSEMESVIDQAEEHFDQVIIDSPPLLAVTDAQLLADLCDGLLLVVKSGSTPIDKVRKAAESLTETSGKLLGVVLNNRKKKAKDGYSYFSNSTR